MPDIPVSWKVSQELGKFPKVTSDLQNCGIFENSVSYPELFEKCKSLLYCETTTWKPKLDLERELTFDLPMKQGSQDSLTFDLPTYQGEGDSQDSAPQAALQLIGKRLELSAVVMALQLAGHRDRILKLSVTTINRQDQICWVNSRDLVLFQSMRLICQSSWARIQCLAVL
jgi:hypothetical protein